MFINKYKDNYIVVKDKMVKKKIAVRMKKKKKMKK